MIVTQPSVARPTFTRSAKSDLLNPGPVGSSTQPAGPGSTPRDGVEAA